MIVVISCISADPTIVSPVLVEHFFKYYTPQADKFVITLNQRTRNQEVLDVYEAILTKYGVKMHRFWEGDFDSVRKMAYLAEDFAQAGPNDWLLTVDSDEFYIFPDSPKQFLKDVAKANCDCVLAQFVDRVDIEGQLREITPDPLDRQFPVTCKIATAIHGSHICIDKVFASRSHIKLTGGHHRVKGAAKPYAHRLDTHHFKWDALLLQRMRQRLEISLANDFSYHWEDECRTGLEYMARYGRIDPKLIQERKYECPSRFKKTISCL